MGAVMMMLGACGSDDPSGQGGMGANGGSAPDAGGAGGAAAGGSGGSTGGSAGAGATGGTGGTGATGGTGGTGGANPGAVVGLDGVAAFDAMSNADKDTLRATKVLFYHMSVGGNLLSGYNHWDPPWVAGAAYLGFEFDTADSASAYDNGLKLGELAFGFNGDPFAKIDEYENVLLGQGYAGKLDVAGFKFCYNDVTVDVTATADDVIAAYEATYDAIESAAPGIRFFHVTTPLQPANQWQTVENNTLRIKLGSWMKTRYAGGRHVVFDLQEVESTTSGGEACQQGGVRVLCDEWKGDNDGHLNDEGSTRAAKAFLYAISLAAGH